MGNYKNRLTEDLMKAIDILVERKNLRLKPTRAFQGPYYHYLELYEHEIMEIARSLDS